MAQKHKQFMAIAKTIADQLSKDRTRKVGAIFVNSDNIIISSGYNGFVRSVDDTVEERHHHPLKLMWSEHAERNAIYSAARLGVSLLGSRLYVTTLPPCLDCARAIIQVGCTEIYIEKSGLSSKDWTKDWDLVLEMFNEAKVTIEILDTNGNSN